MYKPSTPQSKKKRNPPSYLDIFIDEIALDYYYYYINYNITIIIPGIY